MAIELPRLGCCDHQISLQEFGNTRQQIAARNSIGSGLRLLQPAERGLHLATGIAMGTELERLKHEVTEATRLLAENDGAHTSVLAPQRRQALHGKHQAVRGVNSLAILTP